MKGYTKEDIKRILGSSWPTMPEDHETGNQMRRRKGNEMRAGKRPYPKYPSKESRIADTSGKFDENDNTSTQRMLDLIMWNGVKITLTPQRQGHMEIRYHDS